jgi:hypothetical protein
MPRVGRTLLSAAFDVGLRAASLRVRQKAKSTVKLADGKERSIQHMVSTTFWHPDGTPMSAQQFMELLFGKLPEFFQDEAELRALWSAPDTRKKPLMGLAEKGFGHEQLAEMQRIIDAEKSDLFDVLAYVAYALPTLTRKERADRASVVTHQRFNTRQQSFLNFVLAHYVGEGVSIQDGGKLAVFGHGTIRQSGIEFLDSLGPRISAYCSSDPPACAPSSSPRIRPNFFSL